MYKDYCLLPWWVWGSINRCKVVLVDLWASDNLWYSIDGLKESGRITSWMQRALNKPSLRRKLLLICSVIWYLVWYFLSISVITSVRMSAGTPVAMRMVHSCCSRPHWYIDFWQLAVAPGEFTGDTITRTNWEKYVLTWQYLTVLPLEVESKAAGQQCYCALPAAWGEGWWPSVQTSQSYHHRPQTRASFSECKSPPWRNSDWSCCSLAGWAAKANSPPPQYLLRAKRIYIST